MQETRPYLPTPAPAGSVLVMGVGNTLLQDDGVGVHVAEAFRDMPGTDPSFRCIDGGTLGLSLLPDVEDAAAVIIVDAAEIGAAPGTIRVFNGEEADQRLGGNKNTVHELAVADLFAAASLNGKLPALRALVAIQPDQTTWGLQPTAAVKAAIPQACIAIRELTRSWRHEA
jgi:hydrogenase maturation protease